MRLPVFLLLAVGVSLVVGGVFGFFGAGFWPSVVWAMATLIVLQVSYFLFLMLEARKVRNSKVLDNSD